MRILYGVQATGQGHISRARAMATALAPYDVEVTWLFSGRDRAKLFDMQPFGPYLHRAGLTFTTRNGSVRYGATLFNSRPLRFARDVISLNVAAYDRVLTDFEPVSAWAARRAGVRSIGIGHQYAFGAHTPTRGGNPISKAILQWFAPVDVPIGLHWHPYSDHVLPPILDLPDIPVSNQGYVLVYLPFEDQRVVTQLLHDIPGQNFVQYANGLEQVHRANVMTHPASTATFKRHLAGSAGVICNSGFELISECLQWGKPVLTKPLQGQMEQLSNALTLEQLGLAQTTRALSSESIRRWLAAPTVPPASGFADVAATLARWVAQGCRETPQEIGLSLWPENPGALLPGEIACPA
ncbi:MAG: glycosyltransferase family protein [Halioglobus sp.]